VTIDQSDTEIFYSSYHPKNLMSTQNFYSFIDLFLSSAMKKRAMKKTAKSYKTTSGAKRAVFKGIISKTKGGLSASTLMKNKHGKIVSKKQSAAASKKLGKWLKAVAAARKALGIKGMVPVGGKSAKGAALYKKAKSQSTSDNE
jgi:hypothetical protein